MAPETNDNYRDATFLEWYVDQSKRSDKPVDQLINSDDEQRIRKIADRLRKEGYGRGNPAQHSGK